MNKNIVLFILAFLIFSQGHVYAQEQPGQKADLAKLSQEYFAKGDYEGFYQYLKGLKPLSPAAYYYLALTRQREIDSWKKEKNWEGVYDKGPSYKKDISDNLKEAKGSVKDDTELLLNIKYLNWQNAREDDPDRSVGLFNDLVNTARDLALAPKPLLRVKAFADEISNLEDKNLARRLYEAYVAKLSGSGLSKEDLKAQAQQFLSEGNAYLAKSLFDVYLNSFSGDLELKARETVALADRFANGDTAEGLDPVFAEEMYKKAYDSAGNAAFKSDSLYRRAFNLERMKEFNAAYDGYNDLLSNDPDYARKQNIYFRMGVIAAYAKKDTEKAAEYFLKIKDAFPGDVLAVCSLYQLGLLSQFKKDFEKAKEYYNALIVSVKLIGLDAQKNELVLLTQERLKETEEGKEMKYGLKLFIEGIFKTLPLSVDLTARPWQSAIGEPIKFVVATSSPQTGCMTPVYSYEWSGETGSVSNIPNAPELTTDYASAGIKVAHVALVGPQGPEGVGFEIAEVKENK
ncbi:MAG: tetratricopeptide repeat protein [Candidatus Omnitrophota bacterium]